MTYHATRYHRGLPPVTCKFQAPDNAPPLELLTRGAKAHGKPRGRMLPTSHLAAAIQGPHARLIIHRDPTPPADPFHQDEHDAHRRAALYRIAHQAHRDAMQADPVAAATLAAATGDLHDTPGPLAYRAEHRPASPAKGTGEPRTVIFPAPPRFTRRQLVQRAKERLAITGDPLRNTSEFLAPPRIMSEGGGMVLRITPYIEPQPLRPEDISDDEV